MREVICHYHIYKNAGTSFDHVLRESFGDRHLSFDGPFPFFTIDQEQLLRIIERKAGAVAFSSHQIQLPAPSVPGCRILPVVFLRDPVLRIASIWRFKARFPDGTATSEAAGRMGFADWVDFCLNDPAEIVHVSNAQTRLLSAAPRARPESRRTPGRMEYDLARAEANLAGAAVGRADRFDEDIGAIARLSAARGLPLRPPGDLRLNVTDPDRGEPAARALRVLGELAPDLRDRLLRANDQDLRLNEIAGRRARDLREAA
ncbi:MAG: hypothetical protein ACKVPY_05630 [Paracoccaceae bacterium]